MLLASLHNDIPLTTSQRLYLSKIANVSIILYNRNSSTYLAPFVRWVFIECITYDLKLMYNISSYTDKYINTTYVVAYWEYTR